MPICMGRRLPQALLSMAAFVAFSSGLLTAGPRVEDGQVVQGPVGGVVVRDGDGGRGPARGAPPAAGTALVSGAVVSADGKRPVRRATIRLFSATAGAEYTATSDDQGRFQLQKVAAGQYTLTASKAGFLDSTYGQKRPGSGRPGTPLSIAEGQRVERLSLPIARSGVLAGTVVDDVGEAVYGTEVQAFKYEWQGGDRLLRFAGSDRTDDRGGYRIAALLPGDYVVMAGGDGGTTDITMMRVGRGGGS